MHQIGTPQSQHGEALAIDNAISGSAQGRVNTNTCEGVG